MAARETGVDIVAKAKDEATPALSNVSRSIAMLGRNVEEVGARMRGKLADGVVGGLAAVSVGNVLDETLRNIHAAVMNGQSAFDIGVGIMEKVQEGMRSIPVAGALGEILGDTVFDAIWGGPIAAARAQKETREALNERGKIYAKAQEFERRLTADTVDAAEARARAYREEADAILSAARARLAGDDLRQLRQELELLIQQRLERERAAEEQRIREREEREHAEEMRRREEQRRREEERQAREAEQQRREREREAEREEQEAARRRRELLQAEERLGGAEGGRLLSGRAAAFRASRQDLSRDRAAERINDLQRLLAPILRNMEQQLGDMARNRPIPVQF